MPFRPPKKQPQFADLIGILAQSPTKDNALYQTVQEIINRLTQFQTVTLEQQADINNSVNSSITEITNLINSKQTYITKNNETLTLPNSVQILAGTGVTLDYTVPNKLTVSATGGGGLGSGHWTPLTDGDLDETHLIFSLGDCIMVFVPAP